MDEYYELSHQKKDNQLVLTCKNCRKSTIVFNNKTIEEEYLGISGYYEELSDTVSCKNIECHNYGICALKEPEEYQIAPAVRVLTKAIGKQFGKEKGNSKYLYSLFPYGPGKQGCRFAGLPKPTGCI